VRGGIALGGVFAPPAWAASHVTQARKTSWCGG
jgi:hypothetical protein